MTVLFVAEIGSMHEGSPALACEMIRQAAKAGATVAKFQFGWNADVEAWLGLAPKPIRYLDDAFVDTIAGYCQTVGIELMASIWSEQGLAQAKRVHMRRYKIASQMSKDFVLLEKVLADHRITYVSGGEWSERTVPIWCVSKYPTYPADLADMPVRFGDRWFGYSDHAHGIGACLLAVARGAEYVEKHFTLNKASQAVRDAAFSATPDEFADLTRMGKEIEMVR